MISSDAKDFITKALIKDKDDRYDAKMLLDHAWIHKQVKEPEVGERAQLDIFNNLREFRDVTVFQSGVLSFIVNLKATSEELEELKNLFIQLDKSKDGTLSMEEIRDGMDLVLGKMPGSKAKYEDLMRSLDKDGNGVIDYTEFITGAIDKAVMLSKLNLQAAFKLIDRDNSGMITLDELKAVFGGGHGDDKDESLWIEIMSEVDKNNDNQISFDEFTDVMTQLLKKQHLR